MKLKIKYFSLFFTDRWHLFRSKSAGGYIRTKSEVALTFEGPHGSLASCTDQEC